MASKRSGEREHMPAVTENFRIQSGGYLSLAIPFVERLIFQAVTSLRLVHRTQALFTERLDAVFRNRTFHFLQELRITLCDSEFPSERYVIKLNPNRACQMLLVTGIGSANQGKIEIQNFTGGTTPGYVDGGIQDEPAQIVSRIVSFARVSCDVLDAAFEKTLSEIGGQDGKAAKISREDRGICFCIRKTAENRSGLGSRVRKNLSGRVESWQTGSSGAVGEHKDQGARFFQPTMDSEF